MVFDEVIVCNVADVSPVALTQSVLALASAGSTGDLSMRFEYVVDMLTNNFEVSIGYEFVWIESDFTNEFLHGTFEGRFF